jgi:hypothetical protein
MRTPKINDIWKDEWLNRDGTVKCVDVFRILEIDADSPNELNIKKGFIKEYIIAGSGCRVGEKDWKYNSSLESFKYRRTTLFNEYYTPLYQVLNNFKDKYETKN